MFADIKADAKANELLNEGLISIDLKVPKFEEGHVGQVRPMIKSTE